MRKEASPAAIIIAVVILIAIIAMLWYVFVGRKPETPGMPGVAPTSGPYDRAGAPPPPASPPDGVPVAPGGRPR
jgi:hypothetical protein